MIKLYHIPWICQKYMPKHKHGIGRHKPLKHEISVEAFEESTAAKAFVAKRLKAAHGKASI